MYEGHLKVLLFPVLHEIVDHFKHPCYGSLNSLSTAPSLRKKELLDFFSSDLSSFKNTLRVILYCLNLEKKVKYNSRNKKAT